VAHLKGVQRANDVKGACLLLGMATLTLAAMALAAAAIAALSH
jgi:hypothetical protein